MTERFRGVVHATVFAVLLGWVLYIGREILEPIVLAILVLYVIIGAARLLSRMPVLGPALPMQVHYALATLVMLGALPVLVWLALDSVDRLVAQVPHYQSQLVMMVQRGAGLLGIESEPSWYGIREWVLSQVSLQKLASSTVAWIGALLSWLIVIGLYVVFLMIERRHFDAKLERLSRDARQHAFAGRRVRADASSAPALAGARHDIPPEIRWFVQHGVLEVDDGGFDRGSH